MTNHVIHLLTRLSHPVYGNLPKPCDLHQSKLGDGAPADRGLQTLQPGHREGSGQDRGGLLCLHLCRPVTGLANPPGLLLVLLSCLPAPGQLLDMVGPGSTAQETGRVFGNVQEIVVFRMDSWQGCRGSGPPQGKRGKDQGQG
jgi:hypothetical protein